MKKILGLATTFALILGIAASSFAMPNTKVKTPNEKVKITKVVKQKKHRKHTKHRRHRHHKSNVMKTKKS